MRSLVLVALIVGSGFLYRAVVVQKTLRSPFEPTPIPTRISSSYALEGETDFSAGDLQSAITAYTKAVNQDPNNAQLWSELARIETYSSASLTTDEDSRNMLQKALDAANQAVKVAPQDSTAHAVLAFVLDWNANPILNPDKSAAMLTQGEQEASRALFLDNQNTLALAYDAEIMVDEQKWDQAEQKIQLALKQDPSLMDVHRVDAYVKENEGNYNDSITEYQKAADIMPNLTFLYIRIGATYRLLQQFDQALSYFTKAATIEEQLNMKDPIPFIAISKTYSQMGQFFAAALNMRKALQLNPNTPEVYGEIGIIYFQSRNYEGAIPALKCAVKGCPPADSCDVRNCDPTTDPKITIQGMPLTENTVVYYYTYGSVLAAMHLPSDDYCNQAMPILHQVQTAFSSDASIMGIIQPSEEICSSVPTNLTSTTPGALVTPIPTDTLAPGAPTATATQNFLATLDSARDLTATPNSATAVVP
ncbi:MAG: tetratricopeptide repeat protein [Anaerolineaceae bacterium]|nr:tetratricopeptide repeat protein [Anaerolineaceae bacterium]